MVTSFVLQPNVSMVFLKFSIIYFQVKEADVVDRLMSCVKQAAPLFSVSNTFGVLYLFYVLGHIVILLS